MKKLLIVACLSLVSFTADAQQAPSSCNPECTLKVTNPELDLISKGLQTQPFGEVVPLINKLREQIIAQQPKPSTPPTEPKKD